MLSDVDKSIMELAGAGLEELSDAEQIKYLTKKLELLSKKGETAEHNGQYLEVCNVIAECLGVEWLLLSIKTKKGVQWVSSRKWPSFHSSMIVVVHKSCLPIVSRELVENEDFVRLKKYEENEMLELLQQVVVDEMHDSSQKLSQLSLDWPQWRFHLLELAKERKTNRSRENIAAQMEKLCHHLRTQYFQNVNFEWTQEHEFVLYSLPLHARWRYMRLLIDGLFKTARSYLEEHYAFNEMLFAKFDAFEEQILA